MAQRLPTFLIVGAMRSGTTSLYRYLLEHPQVFLPRNKEVHFFDDHYDKGPAWYLQQFSEAENQQQIGEATPNYLYDPLAIERIVETLPGVSLITILRNPVDRAYSHYWHNRSRGKEPLSFEEAISAEPERLRRSPETRRTYSYLDRGRYHKQLTQVFERFPRDSVSISLFDDLACEPRSVFAGLCTFLSVDTHFVPDRLGDAINPFVEFRSVRLRRLAKRLPRPLNRTVGRLNVRRTTLYTPLTGSTRARMQAILAEDIERTSLLIGRDLAGLWLREDDKADPSL